MIKIWGFSFLLFKLKIQQFRGLGMTCEWMRRLRNYIVISSRWNIRFSQHLLISNTNNLLTRLLQKTPPARLDSEYFRKDLLKTSLSFCGQKETLLSLKYVIFSAFVHKIPSDWASLIDHRLLWDYGTANVIQLTLFPSFFFKNPKTTWKIQVKKWSSQMSCK